MGAPALTGPTPEERSARVKALAREVGFDLVGVAPPSLPEAFARYREQVGLGYGAEMGWLTDNPQVRRDVREIWPTARAVVALGVSYASEVPGYLERPPTADEGWIARYAQGKDYHAHVRKMLIRLVKAFEADAVLGGASTDHRVFVDTGPVLEKAFAQAAGLGWIGKNTLLIRPREGGGDEPAGGAASGAGAGSWYFLAVVLTPLELALDTPETDHCGSCRRCLDVCPTDAFPAPYVLDARRCIATWTIESAEPERVIAPEALGQHVFGCDLCQEVCPWNRKTTPTAQAPLRPRPENVRPKLAELAALDEAAFVARFPKSAVRRVDARRLGTIIDLIRHRNDRELDRE